MNLMERVEQGETTEFDAGELRALSARLARYEGALYVISQFNDRLSRRVAEKALWPSDTPEGVL